MSHSDIGPDDPRLKGLLPDVDLERFKRVLAREAERVEAMLAIYDARIIVAGSRSFNDYGVFCDVMECWVRDNRKLLRTPHVWISGAAREGADAMLIRWCEEREIDRPLECFPAFWKAYGKPAGFRRNATMGDMATHLVAFYDGRSPGTKSMLQIAKTKGLETQLVLVDPDKD